MKRLREAAWFLIREVYRDPQGELAERQARLARRIFEKMRERQPYELRVLFCRRCKAYSPPLVSKTIRVRGGQVIYRCMKCGGVYRVPFKRGATHKRVAA